MFPTFMDQPENTAVRGRRKMRRPTDVMSGAFPEPSSYDDFCKEEVDEERRRLIDTAILGIPGESLRSFFAPLLRVQLNLKRRSQLARVAYPPGSVQGEKLFLSAAQILHQALVSAAATLKPDPFPLDLVQLQEQLRGKLSVAFFEPGATLVYPHEPPEALMVYVVVRGAVLLASGSNEPRRSTPSSKLNSTTAQGSSTEATLRVGSAAARCQYYTTNQTIRVRASVHPHFVSPDNSRPFTHPTTSTHPSEAVGPWGENKCTTEKRLAPFVVGAPEALGLAQFGCETVVAAIGTEEVQNRTMTVAVTETMCIRLSELHQILVDLGLATSTGQRLRSCKRLAQPSEDVLTATVMERKKHAKAVRRRKDPAVQFPCDGSREAGGCVALASEPLQPILQKSSKRTAPGDHTAASSGGSSGPNGGTTAAFNAVQARRLALSDFLALARVKALTDCFPMNELLLRQSWLLQDLPAATLLSILPQMRALSFPPGALILPEGKVSKPHLFFLRRGTAELVRSSETLSVETSDRFRSAASLARPHSSPHGPRSAGPTVRHGHDQLVMSSASGSNPGRGAERVQPTLVAIETLEEGVTFGELSVLLGEPRMAGIRAKTTCDLWCLSRKNLLRALRCEGEAVKNLQAMAASLRSKWLGEQRFSAALPGFLRRSTRLLRDVPEILLTLVQERLQPVVYSPGTIVTSIADRCDFILFIVRGRLLTIAKGIAAYGPGECIGDGCLIQHRWPFALVARQMVEGWLLTRDSWIDVLERIEVLVEHSGESVTQAGHLLAQIFTRARPPEETDFIGRPILPVVPRMRPCLPFRAYADEVSTAILRALCFRFRAVIKWDDIKYATAPVSLEHAPPALGNSAMEMRGGGSSTWAPISKLTVAAASVVSQDRRCTAATILGGPGSNSETPRSEGVGSWVGTAAVETGRPLEVASPSPRGLQSKTTSGSVRDVVVLRRERRRGKRRTGEARMFLLQHSEICRTVEDFHTPSDPQQARDRGLAIARRILNRDAAAAAGFREAGMRSSGIRRLCRSKLCRGKCGGSTATRSALPQNRWRRMLKTLLSTTSVPGLTGMGTLLARRDGLIAGSKVTTNAESGAAMHPCFSTTSNYPISGMRTTGDVQNQQVMTVLEAVERGLALQFPDGATIQNCVSAADPDVTVGLPTHRGVRKLLSTTPTNRLHHFHVPFAASRLAAPSHSTESVSKKASVQPAMARQLRDLLCSTLGKTASAMNSTLSGSSGEPAGASSAGSTRRQSDRDVKVIGSGPMMSSARDFLSSDMSPVVCTGCTTPTLPMTPGMTTVAGSATSTTVSLDVTCSLHLVTSIEGTRSKSVADGERAMPLPPSNTGTADSGAEAMGENWAAVTERLVDRPATPSVGAVAWATSPCLTAVDAHSRSSRLATLSRASAGGACGTFVPSSSHMGAGVPVAVPPKFSMPILMEVEQMIYTMQSDVVGLNLVTLQLRKERREANAAKNPWEQAIVAVEQPADTTAERLQLTALNRMISCYRDRTAAANGYAAIPSELKHEAGLSYVSADLSLMKPYASGNNLLPSATRASVKSAPFRPPNNRGKVGMDSTSYTIVSSIGSRKFGFSSHPLVGPADVMTPEEYAKWVLRRESLFNRIAERRGGTKSRPTSAMSSLTSAHY